MIIYGYKHRNVNIATGQFHCPRCQAQRTYDHINIVRMFTLFFIPLFPLGRVGSYIECQTCHSTFKPEELTGMQGNEVFTQELNARNAAADVKGKERRGCVTAVLGTLLAGAGALGFLILVIFQFTNGTDPTEGLVGLACMMAICPIPLLLAGTGLLAWGVRIRQKASDAAATAASLPMS